MKKMHRETARMILDPELSTWDNSISSIFAESFIRGVFSHRNHLWSDESRAGSLLARVRVNNEGGNNHPFLGERTELTSCK